MISRGEFREDLYYRLKVVDIDLPALEKRRQDIPELVGYLLHKFNMRLGANIQHITPAAMEVLTRYNWPGNIRELSNVIERAVLFCDEDTIDVQHLPMDVINFSSGH